MKAIGRNKISHIFGMQIQDHTMLPYLEPYDGTLTDDARGVFFAAPHRTEAKNLIDALSVDHSMNVIYGEVTKAARRFAPILAKYLVSKQSGLPYSFYEVWQAYESNVNPGLQCDTHSCSFCPFMDKTDTCIFKIK